METYLLPGHETEQSIDILLSMTSLKSDGMRKALRYHLVNGAADKYACIVGGVTKGNFSRDLKKLNDIAKKIDDYVNLNYKNVTKITES